MTVCSADLAKSINTVWDDSTLDAAFKALWDSSVDPDEFPVLNDQEAMPGQPFPYCVFEASAGTTTDRMSGGRTAIREIRDVPVEFRVHARAVDGDSRTAKEIAAALAEEVMKTFGGHPSVAAASLTLDAGNFLLSQYQNDYSIRTGDQEHSWTVSYICRLDVPIAV